MAVAVEHLWKTFQIPHERRTTLFENLVGMMRPNHYETFTALKDVCFEVEEGECVGIIGDNGCGKSTLLKIIANILRPSRGSVRVEGKLTPFLELGVGFQPELTVRENIGVYATIMGLSRREIAERTDDVIDFAGLQKFEDTKLKNLSSGMQVRLAFSTAIQTDPDILLVDEILAVGDMEFQQKCFEVFDRYRKEGVTILFVSHDLGAVRRFCDKTLLLRDGEQVALGETNRIIDSYIYKFDKDDLEEAKVEVKDESRVAMEETEKRWGDRKIEITKVMLLDKNGRESSNFVSGDPLNIKIFYKTKERMDSPVFGIALYWEDTYCYGTSSEIKGCQSGLIHGTGYAECFIERLPLLRGRFDLSVAVADPHYTAAYDWHDRLYSFDVHNPTRNLGIFDVDCKWKIVKDL
ncbi:MAG TPA: ABC transporter ATP-binding protein [Methanothrix sp.]|nr:ABC transporter ATP-binding protein [Methanothrix sp.]